jgi:type 2 lantibiotic biosynthesis protein LanM
MARKRFEKWVSQAPFKEGNSLATRLAFDGLSQQDFLDCLGRSAASIMDAAGVCPQWHAALDRLIAQTCPPGNQSAEVQGLAIAIEPFLQWGKEQLLDALRRLQSGPHRIPFGGERLAGLLLTELGSRLGHSALRTLLLEMNVARLQGKLTREVPAERFQEYCDGFRRPSTRAALFSEYPVLARLLWERTSNWLDFSVEFVERLAADWSEMRLGLLAGRDAGGIKELRTSAGDPHRGGRSVVVVVFESGARVVYKPHSLAVDVHFQGLLAWFNQRGWQPAFRQLGILNRKNHGWVEFIERRSCDTREEVARFYRRAGGLLAILHLLEATDFHYENIIACGSDPVPVDLEALFHPRLSQLFEQPFLRFTAQVVEETVLRVGLLPQKVAIADGGELDVGGLSAEALQETPFQMASLENPGTDLMRFASAPGKFTGGGNRPQVGGEEVGLEDYVEEIAGGFKDAYGLVLAHKDEFTSPGGPIERFAEDEVRLIARPTKLYARFLEASLHPNVMRNALDRDRLLDRLFVGSNLRPTFLRIAQAERADIESGDIPFLAVRPNSCDVTTSRGTVLEGLLQHGSLQTAMSRLVSINNADMERQLSVIRGTIAAHAPEPDGQGIKSAVPLPVPDAEHAPSRAELIEAARKIADRIANTALVHHGLVTWMTMKPMPTGWKMLPMDFDFYGGMSGVSVFLAFLAEITGEERHRELADRALSTALASIEALDHFQPPLKPRLGAFSGVGGPIFALCALSQLWRKPELLNQAERLTARGDSLIETDTSFNFLDGVAGYSSVMEVLYRISGSTVALDQMVRCGRHLVASAKPVGDGAAWEVGGTALTGLSHGASGIALALFRIASITRESACRETAEAALRFERFHFNCSAGEWADLQLDSSRKARVDWCHGAPGIGLARLGMRPFVEGSEIAADVEAALSTTCKRGFGRSHCLCHGDLGNALFLHEAGSALLRPDLMELAGRRAADCLRSTDWHCGTPRAIETPSFMLGWSGMGYALLRLAAPEKVPFLLTLRLQS